MEWFAIGIVLVIFELVTPSMLFFTCLAVGAFVAGIVSLFADIGFIYLALIFAIVALASVLTIRPIFKKTMLKSKQYKTNVDALIGRHVQVTEDISPMQDGMVKAGGEFWLAWSDSPIKAGETVVVESVSGTKLKVKSVVK
jgi:membrane protein implicated in regulation of membrane protease activity